MIRFVIAFCAAVLAMPALAATPRDMLVDAAFVARDKAAALAEIGRANAGATAILARAPGDRDSRLDQSLAVAYRAKLQRSRGDAVAARTAFEGLVAAQPRDPQALLALAGWHIDAVRDLGGFIAGAALGAKKATGLALLDRSVAASGGRATFPGFAALLRLSLDPADPQARALAEAATHAATPMPLDRIMQRAATIVLVPLRAGDGGKAQALAKQLLPFGRLAT